MHEEELAGGVANAGKVTRVGREVLRPANPNSESVHAFLRSLRTAGFTGASEPVAIEADGRERLQFIEGRRSPSAVSVVGAGRRRARVDRGSTRPPASRGR
jgi:hypothetical protein